MATHSSVLAWRIPRTEEPGGLLSMGSHRVGHNRSDLAAAAAVSNFLCIKNVLNGSLDAQVYSEVRSDGVFSNSHFVYMETETQRY